MVKVIVVAVPGSGKTTILRKLAEIKPDVKIVNFGDFMFEVAREKYEVTNRDEMRRKIPYEDYKELQLMAAARIGEMEGAVVIDTHAAVKTPYGYYPGMPLEVVKRVKPTSIVALEFNPSDILARRAKDSSTGVRDRESEDEREIEGYQSVNRAFAISAANAVPCYFLQLNFRYKESYPYQHVEDAAKGLKEHIELLEKIT